MARKPSRQQADKLRQYTKTSQEAFNTIQANSGAPNIDTSSIRQADNLRNALGSLSGSLNRVQAAQQAEKDKLDIDRKKFFALEIAKDNDLSLLDKAQIGEIYPDKSPIVLAAITEAVGNQWAREWTQKQVDIINQNPALINDTASRQAAIDSIRDKLVEEVGDRSFFGAGAAEGMNGVLNSNEGIWVQQAAQHHTKVQNNHLYSLAENIFNKNLITEEAPDGTPITKVDASKSLLELDALFKKTRSLNNFQRRETITSAAIIHALNNRDMGALDAIQGVLLGKEEKTRIQQAKEQVIRLMDSDWQRANRLEVYERDQKILSEKQAISKAATDGTLDSFNYSSLTTSEGQDYFLTKRNQEFIPEKESGTNRDKYDEQLTIAMIGGDWSFFGFEDSPSSQEIRDWIEDRDDLNQDDILLLSDEVDNYVTAHQISRSQESTQTVKSLLEQTDLMIKQYTASFALDEVATPDKLKVLSNAVGDIKNVYQETLARKIKNYFKIEGNDKASFARDREKLESEALQVATQKYNYLVEVASAEDIQTLREEFPEQPKLGQIAERDGDDKLYKYIGGLHTQDSSWVLLTEEEATNALSKEARLAEEAKRKAEEEAKRKAEEEEAARLKALEGGEEGGEASEEQLGNYRKIIDESKDGLPSIFTDTDGILSDDQFNSIKQSIHEVLLSPQNSWLLKKGVGLDEEGELREETYQKIEEIVAPIVLEGMNLTGNEDFDYLGLFEGKDNKTERATRHMVRQFIMDRMSFLKRKAEEGDN